MPHRNLGLKTYHSKTRNGCKRCKRRRVKCNLQGPVCSNCNRRNEVCEYATVSEDVARVPLPTGSLARESLSALSVETLRLKASVLSPSLAFSVTVNSFEILMDSCLRQTIWLQGIVGNETILWRDLLAPHMGECYYLQHGLSSLIFLHEATRNLHPAVQARSAAYQHHLVASKLFRASTSLVNESNWVTVLLFSISVIVFHFAADQISPDDTFDYMETFSVLRVSFGAFWALGPFFGRSNLWHHIRLRVGRAPKPFDREAQIAIKNLGSLVDSSPDDCCEIRRVCMEGFGLFKTWAYDCASYPRHWKHYMDWPASVSSEFVQLLSEGNDVATLILIYWCAFMHRSPSQWFLEYWPRRAATFAVGRLTGSWTNILTWPTSVLLLPNGNDASSGELFDHWPETLQAIGF